MKTEIELLRQSLALIRDKSTDAQARSEAAHALRHSSPLDTLRRERDEAIAAANTAGYRAERLQKKLTLFGANKTFIDQFIWSLGTHVRKKSGAEWSGKVVGFYSTSLTPVGYCIESSSHRGSVQIYPESALELL